MRYRSLRDFLARGRTALAAGPVAMIFVEDLAGIDSTIRHHQARGFAAILLFADPEVGLDPALEAALARIDYDTAATGALERAVDAVIGAAPGQWLYYCYNAEYLFFPFCETRSIGEMLAFHSSERRDAMLAYVVDAYADDLSRFPDAVSLDAAFIDKAAYYALARTDPATGHVKERQYDVFGGLKWRFEDHVPEARRRIDRIALFRAKPGLRLRPDHTFTDEEYNTCACPWHHNLTAAIVSFRTAKALKTNPASRHSIPGFLWRNSVPLEWTSQQLLDLGLMEPGQWF